ncbi:MAG TPA: hypothetical protein VFF10_05230 [Trueperaceae bacterium]|nr:hypothetical protein [Trueperaceae bacterium]
MLSVHSLVFSLGIAVASGPLGWLASATSPRLALWISGLLTISACAAYAVIGRIQRAEAGHRAAQVTSPGSGGGGLTDALLLDDSSVPDGPLDGVRR